MQNPKISCVIPFHWMPKWPFFLERCLKSIEAQTFKDYEIILIKHSTMPITSNAVIQAAKGELIKILYLDDYLAHPNSLKNIVENFDNTYQWLVTGCLHKDEDGKLGRPHLATINENLHIENTIGSPSVLTIRNNGQIFFDENLSFFLDCDLYMRYYKKYGAPKILDDLNVVIGLHQGQTTHLLSDEEKQREFNYSLKKHESL